MYKALSQTLNKTVTEETLLSLPRDCRIFLEDLATTLTDAGVERSTRPKEWIEPRHLLRSYLKRKRLKADLRTLMRLEPEDEFELWSNDLRFLIGSGGFFKISSLNIDDIWTCDWNELFVRGENERAQIRAAIVDILTDKTNLVEDVTDWHLVQETRGKFVKVEVRVKSLSALHNSKGQRIGLMAITNLRSPSNA
jgi:hypothetical protein